ncbi:MAG: hypothetical protein U0324_37030 [Polyangiales bacterium]
MAARNVSRYTQAIDAFERFLATPPASAGPELLAQVRGHVVEMRQRIGTLTVAVSPPPTTVALRRAAHHLTAENLPIDPGPHDELLRRRRAPN